MEFLTGGGTVRRTDVFTLQPCLLYNRRDIAQESLNQ